MGSSNKFDVKRYLDRIRYSGDHSASLSTLRQLHECHVFEVPFENLDIQHKKLFNLEIGAIFEKVVVQYRGGFCYELNSLFNWLLQQLGFDSWLISASILDNTGSWGPKYDHMAICVNVDERLYLVDVGFGDLFTLPLQIANGVQHDGRNYFMIRSTGSVEYRLFMSTTDSASFQCKYQFSVLEVEAERFRQICLEKQTHTSSWFVKNLVVTKPVKGGRVTLFNNKLTVVNGNLRYEREVSEPGEVASV